VPLPLVVFLVGTSVALLHLFTVAAPDWYMGISPTPPSTFATSAMYAAGHGLKRPYEMTSPEMQAFFNQQIPRMSLADIPDDLKAQTDSWDLRHQYLLYSVGLFWRITGPSWPAVKVFLALAYGLSFLLAYLFCRTVMRPALAFIVTWAAMNSPEFLHFFSSIRDGLKTPFFYAIFLLIAVLIRYRQRVAIYLAISAAMGLIIGLGLGFRHDIYVCIFPAVACVLLCGRPERERVWLTRVAAAALVVAGYLLASWPVREPIRTYGVPSHDIVMGMATDAWTLLEITPSSYELPYVNNDALVMALAEGVLQRTTDLTSMRGSLIGEELALRQLLKEVVSTTPYDWLFRLVASFKWVLSGARDNILPQGVPVPWTISVWPYVMVAAAALAYLLGASRCFWEASLAAVFVGFFSTYITLQFQFRHGFHLALAAPWILGILAERWVQASGSLWPGAMARALGRGAQPKQWKTPAARRALLGLSAALTITMATLLVAALVQRHRLDALLDRYEEAELRHLEVETCTANDWVLIQPLGIDVPPTITQTEAWFSREDYLVVDLDGAPEPRPMWLVYQRLASDVLPYAFSYRLFVPATADEAGGQVRAFIPIYHNFVDVPAVAPDVDFVGIAIRQEDVADFRGVSHVSNLRDFKTMPLLWTTPDRRYFDYLRGFGRQKSWYPGDKPPVTAAECAAVASAP
jgi:hypothetical protein